MSDRLWQRLGAASGIVYVVLLIGGGSFEGNTIGIAFLVVILAFLFFLFFLGNLWSALRRAEGGSGWLSATAFGAGLMSVTIKVASAAPVLAARYRAGDGLDPQLARTLEDINDASFYLSFFPLAVLLGAFAIVAIRSGALPKWLGWIAAALGLAFIAGGMSGSADLHSEWAGLPMILFTFWVIAVSVVLIRRVGAARSAEKETPVEQAAPIG
jgi:hypothetical protein